MVPLGGAGGVSLNLVPLLFLSVQDHDVRETHFVVPTSLDHNSNSVIHHTSGVTTSFVELS